jgi:hypothetical protein
MLYQQRSTILYQPLKITIRQVAGIYESLEDMRLPFTPGYTLDRHAPIPIEDLQLASRLVLAGNDEGKAMRTIQVWLRLVCQMGWLIEFVTYRIGVECASSTSTMHTSLKHLKGEELAEEKQRLLPTTVYERGEMIGYQALRAMYKARRTHRHHDWQIFCRMVESLPYFEYLIYPEKRR